MASERAQRVISQSDIIENSSSGVEHHPIDSVDKSIAPRETSVPKEPSDSVTLYTQAQSCFEKGLWQNARYALEKILSIDPEHDGALCLLGEVWHQLGNYDKALEIFRQSIRFYPGNYRTYCRLGDACQSIGRPDDAAHAYAAALKLRPDDPDIIASLALALTRLGKKEQALLCYQKAISCRPEDHTFHNQYATVLEKCNRLSEARAAIDKSLSVCPHNYGAVVNLATIEYREGRYAEAYRLFKQLDLTGRTLEAAATIKQQEGLTLDKLGRYSEAFDCFQKSNQFAMRTPAFQYLRKEYEADLKSLKRMANSFSGDMIASWEKTDFEADPNPPVFLVGFPRSGTTLMEQILNAHPQVATLDERSPLQRIVEDFADIDPASERLNKISTGEIYKYREAYFELLKIRANASGKEDLIVDKLPLNILHLPLIYRFFPDALIIVALRHPLDCILSNFIQRFKLNKKMMNFLALKNAAMFYDLTMGLYLRFRESIPLPMHEIQYERLTADIEEQTRSLSSFLGIEWTPHMVQYHSKAAGRIINTPSYTEVIKPIHRKAVYRWKNYQEQLKSVIPVVHDYIDRFGYDLCP